jgi:hypothetical protein
MYESSLYICDISSVSNCSNGLFTSQVSRCSDRLFIGRGPVPSQEERAFFSRIWFKTYGLSLHSYHVRSA